MARHEDRYVDGERPGYRSDEGTGPRGGRLRHQALLHQGLGGEGERTTGRRLVNHARRSLVTMALAILGAFGFLGGAAGVFYAALPPADREVVSSIAARQLSLIHISEPTRR